MKTLLLKHVKSARRDEIKEKISFCIKFLNKRHPQISPATFEEYNFKWKFLGLITAVVNLIGPFIVYYSLNEHNGSLIKPEAYKLCASYNT